MPELPEVETVMRGLDVQLRGRVIRHAAVARPALRFPTPPHLAKTLTNARVLGFRRRGKYMFMRLDGGQSMLLHLGMSGRVTIARQGAETPRKHEQLVLETDDDHRIALVDPRRFGCIDLVPTDAEDAHRLLANMGPEPLERAFTPAVLAQALEGKRGPIKAALLDQRLVAGLGNIYVCESLFRARISPDRAAGKLSKAECSDLCAQIKAVLRDAIAAGGSSLKDYAQPNGELGYFQHGFRVYGRVGQPCPQCPGTPECGGVKRVTQAGRSTFFCPILQAT